MSYNLYTLTLHEALHISIAKNYLSEKEVRALNRIVTRYLDYAEDQAERKRPMYMKDWKNRLDAFLEFDEREILHNAGMVEKADRKSTRLNSSHVAISYAV